jgi:hypothetical protein
LTKNADASRRASARNGQHQRKQQQTKAPATKRMPLATKSQATAKRKPSEARRAPVSTKQLTAELALVRTEPPALYDQSQIVDAPEFHGLARAMGTLTAGTWNDTPRSFEDRRADFLFAYPPSGPVKNISGRLQRQQDRTFAPSKEQMRLERFLSYSWAHGSLYELLSRFGLTMRNAPPHQEHALTLDPLREVAKRRNIRLRVLHGGVDVEPANMDAAKAEYLDRQEKQQAARDIREARARMQTLTEK